MQDLYDTLRDEEAKISNVDEKRVVSGAGKESLGGGVLVGLTITLNNAKISFEARSGPTYVQCNISGGNLVAVDSIGDPMSAIEPTAFTQIVLANSSSATLQELGAIQYSSFGGMVSIDAVNGQSGTDFPIGTIECPVDNLADAKLIASGRGFSDLRIVGDITLGATDNIDGYDIIGQDPQRTRVTLVAGVSSEGCNIANATVQGTLDGDTWIRESMVENLTYIQGQVESCVLIGEITLAGNETIRFVDCYDGTAGMDDIPIIDMGGTGRDLVVAEYSGELKIKNQNGVNDNINIDLVSGAVILDSTVNGGRFFIRGVGTLEDNSTSTTLLERFALINNDAIADEVWDVSRPGHEILQHHNNRYEVKDSPTSELWLYGDDGTTVIRKWPLRNKDGSLITLQGTGPSDRLARTL